MRRRLPAIALLISTMITPLFGFEIGIGFQLALVFAVGLYLTRNLERVLPRPEPICLRRLKQLTVSASAGVGAAFSLLVFEAFHDFFARTPKADRIHELVVIGLVSVGVMVFLEPLSEKLRLLLVHDHIMLKSKKSLWLRLAVLGVLLSTSLLDGMAHTAVENWMKDPARTTEDDRLGGGDVDFGWDHVFLDRRRSPPSSTCHAQRGFQRCGIGGCGFPCAVIGGLTSNRRNFHGR